MTTPPARPARPKPQLKVELVRIDSLLPHPNNPRKGDIRAIAESLQTHGQYRPIVVQRSTRYILAGNHTTMAAQSLGWETIEATFVDVDEKGATKILLADNRTADLGGYDQDQLIELLQGLDNDLVGTGYSMEAFDDLIADASTPAKTREPSSWDDRNVTISTTIVFDDAEQQAVWNAFLAGLRSTQEGATHAARLVAFIGTLELGARASAPAVAAAGE